MSVMLRRVASLAVGLWLAFTAVGAAPAAGLGATAVTEPTVTGR